MKHQVGKEPITQVRSRSAAQVSEVEAGNLSATRSQLVTLIAKLSKLYPAMRFGQLVSLAAFLARGPSPSAAWDVDDQELVRAIEEHLARHSSNRICTDGAEQKDRES